MFLPKTYQSLLLLAGGTAAAFATSMSYIASSFIGAAKLPRRTGRRLASGIPTDNWIRDDIGLPPIVDDVPPPRFGQRTPVPPYLPADDRLRADIGLPPLDGSRPLR
jgi:hypothetical protein